MNARWPAPQVARRSASSGRASASTKIGWFARPLEQVLDEVEQAASAHCRSSNTSTTGLVSAIRSKNSRHAAKRSCAVAPLAPPQAEQLREARLDERALVRVGDVLARASRAASSSAGLPAPRPRGSGAHAHHLGERPVRDALAVGEAAAAMPPDGVGDAVDVLLELPAEPRLADAGDAGDRRRAARLRSSARRVEQLLDEAQLAVAADERRLETGRLRWPPRAGDDAQRAPQPDRLGLALELVLARVLEHDRRLGRAPRRLADEQRAGLGRCLDARGRVDEVARDHALARRRRASTAASPVSTPARARSSGAPTSSPSAETAATRSSAGAHRALGVVLVCDRRPPHGHHGVADELLDGAAVELDQPPCGVEVAREELAHLLGVARLGERREADEVGEEHR